MPSLRKAPTNDSTTREMLFSWQMLFIHGIKIDGTEVLLTQVLRMRQLIKCGGGLENNMRRRRKTECLGEEVIIGLGYSR